MKKCLDLLKKYYSYIIIVLVMILLIITWENRIKTIEQLEEKVSSLEYEVERQRMVASNFYTMWHEEKFANEWLWKFYYDNVCDINDEDC